MELAGLAHKRTDDFCFGEKTGWIRRRNAEKNSYSLFQASFEWKDMSREAVLLGMAFGYTEIYLNGRLAAMLTERSYTFDKIYEVYDIGSYLKEGENILSVVHLEAEEFSAAGLALEIRSGKETILATDASWLCRQDFSQNTGGDYHSRAVGEERVDAAGHPESFTVPFEVRDGWETCEVTGRGLLYPPIDRIHQSRIKAQTFDARYGRAVLAGLLAQKPEGIAVSLECPAGEIRCAVGILTAREDAEVLFAFTGFRGAALDGKPVEQGQRFCLEKGEHFLMLVYTGKPELTICAQAKVTLRSPIGEGGLAAAGFPLRPVRYPWNEPSRRETDEKMESLLGICRFQELPDEVVSVLKTVQLNGTACEKDENAWTTMHELRSSGRLLPPNGCADDRLRANMDIRDCDCPLLLEGREHLLSGQGITCFYPQDAGQEILLDFGTEQVGQLEFDLEAPAGTHIWMHAFEMLTDLGVQYMGPVNSLEYICREGRQHYLSRRSRGFRYLLLNVAGHDSPVKFHYIRVREVRYPAEAEGFACSDETLNEIYRMGVRTAQVCMLDLYVDCPGHEQNPWTGDAKITSLVNAYNFGEREYEAQYLRLIAESVEEGVYRLHRPGNPRYQNALYLPCACFPTYPEGCIPVWSFLWLLEICDYYELTGDRELLEDVFGSVRETFARCERMTNDRGLFDMQGAWNLIEWANNDLTFYGEVTANNAMLSFCLKKWAVLAGLLGEEALASHYERLSGQYRDAVNRYCWSEERQAYVDTVRDEYAYGHYVRYMKEREMPVLDFAAFKSQERVSVQSNTMAVLYECAEEERRGAAAVFLLDNVTAGEYVPGTPAARSLGAPDESEAPEGYVHVGSPFFLYFALEALYKLGYDQLAMECMRRDWGEMLAKGMKTCPENFDSKEKRSRSAAHSWSASPAIFLVREVLGVRPLEPGYRKFTVDPKPGDLSRARGEVPTPYGPIRVSWERQADGELAVSCQAPAGCERVLPTLAK